MNSDQFEGKWEQLKGGVQKQWGELTKDDLDVVQGDRKQLIGKIQERYGKAKADAEREVDNWLANQ